MTTSSEIALSLDSSESWSEYLATASTFEGFPGLEQSDR